MPTRVLLSGTGYPGTCRLVRGAAVGSLWLALSGCGATIQPVGNDDAAWPVQPAQPVAAANVTTVPAAMIEAVLDDATRRSGKDRTEIKVVTAEAVTWSDGSLGCPEPGMMYTQALVPGYRVVVQAGEERLAYHASTRGQPSYCPPGRAVVPAPNDAI